MKCKEILEDFTYTHDIIKLQERSKTRMFVIIMFLSVALCLESFYIIYDRKKDSEVEYTVTETTITTEVEQDGSGYNAYHDGIGDINFGTEDKENESSKSNEK